MWSSFHLHFPKANDVKLDFLVAQTVKNLPAVQETRVWSLGWEDPLEKAMATHSSILAWRISWTEEPGGLQSLELQELDMTEQLTLSTLNDVEHLFICLVAIYVFFAEISVLWDKFDNFWKTCTLKITEGITYYKHKLIYHAHRFEHSILLDGSSRKLTYRFNAFPMKQQEDF